MNDAIVTGTVIGLAANIPKIALNFLLYFLKVSEYHCWHMVLNVFLPSNWPFKGGTIVIGGIFDAIFAGALGVGLIYFIRLTRWNYPVFKGIVYTFGTWLFVCLALGGKNFGTPVEVFHSFADHLIWGVFATVLLIKYGSVAVEKRN